MNYEFENKDLQIPIAITIQYQLSGIWYLDYPVSVLNKFMFDRVQGQVGIIFHSHFRHYP